MIHWSWNLWLAPTEIGVLVQNDSSDVQTNTFTWYITWFKLTSLGENG